MKPRIGIALSALALVVLSGCVAPSHATEADELKDALGTLPGVRQVTLDYTEPIVLDSAKLTLTVVMADEADTDSVAAVVRTTYEAFQDVHRDEEGDLNITVGDDSVHLRSFSPKASTEAVAKAALAALDILAENAEDAVAIDINTQDVAKSPHVDSDLLIKIDREGPVAVLKKLADLQRDWSGVPDTDWGVTSSDHWTLRSTKGFPSATERDMFQQLSADLPAGSSIDMTNDFVTVMVPDNASSDEVSVMIDRHLEILGGPEKAAYDVTHGEYFYVLISLGDCTFASDAIGQRLKDELGSKCTKATTSQN